MRGLDGKTAVVTGGATLIGAGVVRAFCEAGTNVAVTDIDAEGGATLERELGERVFFSPTFATTATAAGMDVARAVIGRLSRAPGEGHPRLPIPAAPGDKAS